MSEYTVSKEVERMTLEPKEPFKPLHVRVAEALGWEMTHYPGEGHSHPCGDILLPDPERMRWKGRESGNLLVGREGCTRIPRYDTDWSATGPLIEKYGIGTEPTPWKGDPDEWTATIYLPVKSDPTSVMRESGKGTLEAVCNLLLALKEAGKL